MSMEFVRWVVLARQGEAVVFWGLGSGVLVGVAFVLLRWERRMKSGPDRIKDGGQHIRVVEIGNGWVYIKSQTVLY